MSDGEVYEVMGRAHEGWGGFFSKVKLSLEKRHAIMSITKHPYEPDWLIPLRVRASEGWGGV